MERTPITVGDVQFYTCENVWQRLGRGARRVIEALGDADTRVQPIVWERIGPSHWYAIISVLDGANRYRSARIATIRQSAEGNRWVAYVVAGDVETEATYLTRAAAVDALLTALRRVHGRVAGVGATSWPRDLYPSLGGVFNPWCITRGEHERGGLVLIKLANENLHHIFDHAGQPVPSDHVFSRCDRCQRVQELVEHSDQLLCQSCVSDLVTADPGEVYACESCGSSCSGDCATYGEHGLCEDCWEAEQAARGRSELFERAQVLMSAAEVVLHTAQGHASQIGRDAANNVNGLCDVVAGLEREYSALLNEAGGVTALSSLAMRSESIGQRRAGLRRWAVRDETDCDAS